MSQVTQKRRPGRGLPPGHSWPRVPHFSRHTTRGRAHDVLTCRPGVNTSVCIYVLKLPVTPSPSCPPHPCPCEVQTNKNPVTVRRRRPRRAQGHRHVQAAPRAARFTRPGGPQRPASGARARGPTSSLERSVIRSLLSRRSQGLQDLGGPEQPPPAWRRCGCNRVPWDSANCERFSGSSSLPGPGRPFSSAFAL